METITIFTTRVNHFLQQVHNLKKRTPTILDENLGWTWIMDDLSDERIMKIASTQFPSELMDNCTVAKDFLASLNPAKPSICEELSALELTIHS